MTSSDANPEPAGPVDECRNCAAPLSGPYCAECGQKRVDGPPTVRDFMRDAAEEIFSVDGKLWRTLALLFRHPGALTLELVHGRRARYVKPLRLYLTCSLLAFGVMALTSEGIQIERRDRDEMRDGVSVRRPGDAQIGITTDTMTDAQIVEMQRQIVEGMPTFMFLMVPAFAGLVMLVMRRSGRTYPQHLDFSLHLHSFIFATTAVLLLLNPFGRAAEGISAISRIGLSIVYGVAALRTSYGLRWWGAVWRGGLILTAYLVWMIVAMMLVAAAFLGWWTVRVRFAPS